MLGLLGKVLLFRLHMKSKMKMIPKKLKKSPVVVRKSHWIIERT